MPLWWKRLFKGVAAGVVACHGPGDRVPENHFYKAILCYANETTHCIASAFYERHNMVIYLVTLFKS